jgi:dipeptidyl aminopeptidase/acylaminoacyl peptidase
MNRQRSTIAAVCSFVFAVHTSFAQQQPYQHPPKAIVDVLDARTPPVPIVSPAGGAMLLATPVRYKPIADLAEPFFRGGGIRINPRNNASYLFPYYGALSLQRIPDGAEVPIALPAGARVMEPRWNATGSMFAFANVTASSVELWVGDGASGAIRRLEGVRLNPSLGFTVNWMPDQKTLLVKTVPSGRGEPPAEATVPSGPRIEDSNGAKTASSTYEGAELMKTPYDMDRFDYYGASQMTLVDPISGKSTPVGSPALVWKLLPSPSGEYLLVDRLHRPYTFTRMINRFPTSVEVWDLRGTVVETLASQPLADQVPMDGVRTGPRDHAWRSTAPATLVWEEALDDGDNDKKVPYHDRVMLEPIGGTATELMKTEQRFYNIDWIEGGSLAFVTEYNDEARRSKVWLVNADDHTSQPTLVWSLNTDDAYKSPGVPVMRKLATGGSAVRRMKDAIFMSGDGASPTGNHPFLDRVDLRTLKTERLFQSPAGKYESFVEFVDPAKMTFLTRGESPNDPPNIYLRTLRGTNAQQLTHFTDPAPQLRQITQRLVTYQRPDGLKLSFTLYLPPGYKEGTRLPTVMWAYPLDFIDPSAAGQVAASPQKFTTITGASPVFLALAGYAVLDQTAMPVVGPTATAYDTFNEQIVANAKAAIDKAVEIGVTDPDRVGVVGHSHGALMTANLLAWSDLFRAGVARSGAYNNTLRPFGFQSERRTLYKAMDTYLKLSPLMHADKINEPLLIIHGENDNNPGTVPLQSEKLYEALRGVGGTTRLVILPYEVHGYFARESVEQVLYETVTWFDKYVKNAAPRGK